MKRFLGSLAGAFRKIWTWLRERLRPTQTAVILAAAGFLLIGSAGPASADDATQLELWRQQAKINQLMEQRVAYLEKRVALLETRTPTPYTPGSPPPPTPVYTPSYSPAASTDPISSGHGGLPEYARRVANTPASTGSASSGGDCGLPEYARRALEK